MRQYSVTVEAENEFWVYKQFNTRKEAEEARRVLEKKMPGVKIEVRPDYRRKPKKRQ